MLPALRDLRREERSALKREEASGPQVSAPYYPMISQEVLGERYAVASGRGEATEAAAACLEAGGTVVDAALTASAVLCVVSPDATSLGGDLFALVKQGPEEKILAVNASGAAPSRATAEAYRQLGHLRIPAIGPLSIQAPGLVAGWQALAEQWGSRPLAEILEPAISLARGGCRVGARLAAAVAALQDVSWALPGFGAVFAPHGQPLREGDHLVQTGLSRTLERIAEHGARGFYEGPVARDIAATVQGGGGLLDERDLAEVRAEVVAPLTLKYRDLEVVTQPPISQGVVLLRALRLLSDAVADPTTLTEAELWLRAARALRKAFAERLVSLGDFKDARTTAERMLAGEVPPPPVSAVAARSGTETTTISVIDGAGNAAALIQSVFADLGSGVVSPRSGVLLNNRLSAFFLDSGHPNRLAPRRRTMHTLHTFMVRDADGLRWAGGSPGGDHQPQVNLQVLVRLIDLGQEEIDAVGAPRWCTTPGTDPHDLASAAGDCIECEAGVADDLAQRFLDAGYRVSRGPGRRLGSSNLVGRRSPRGGVAAWVDRRREGSVAAR